MTPVHHTPNPTPPPSPPPEYEATQAAAARKGDVKTVEERGSGDDDNPMIRIVDVDEDGTETVIAEVEGEEALARRRRGDAEGESNGVAGERVNGASSAERGKENRKTPPPLPKR